ncbi:MAG: PD40 domain-containing protein [Chloroflexi bacterium]|nr:PD40 domain-containing protein [Chloroflexota bacterium]
MTRDRTLQAGINNGQVLAGLVQFDLQSLPPGSRVLFAAIEITGRDGRGLGASGEWFFDLIDLRVERGAEINFNAINQPAALASFGNWTPAALASGLTKRWIFTSAQLPIIQRQLDAGKVSIRLRGPASGDNNFFVWDAGPGGGEPTLYISVVRAPAVVVTNTPAPPDVFAAATLVTQLTAQARAIGTPTPLPRSFVTATPGPAFNVVTTVPTAANPTDRAATAVYATAVAVTTGTFTPLPPNFVTATPRPLLVPRAALTAVPTPTATPSLPNPLNVAKRSLPAIFYNKILFLEGSRAAPNVWMMDPDGSNMMLVRDREYYDIAVAREAIGNTKAGPYNTYNAADTAGILQIWAQDLNFPHELPHQLSYLKRGFAWSPAWSPYGQKMAFVSNESGRQEIIVHDVGELHENRGLEGRHKSWKQLTFSTDWWWNQYPSWSPDGKSIVYSSDRGHDATYSEIWMMDADGANQRNLLYGTWDAYAPVWIKWRQ